MDRLFLDANVLFSAAYRKDAGLKTLWHVENALLLTSEYALEEARRNLSDEEQRERLTELTEAVKRVPEADPDLPHPDGIALPDKDWPILLAAIAHRATHLITGDVQDFGPHFGKSIQGVQILRPASYLARHR